MNRIIKGDKVRIISGKYKSKEGVVLSVDLKNKGAIVEGINKVKRHTKPTQQNNNKGGIIEKESLIPFSKLALVVEKAKNGISKVSFIKGKDNKKIRISKKTKTELKKSIKK
ncbi:MAG: 50S ribosomal protein L24 [Mycoplasmataceae bacterium]|jgi:large subunit ribosomal protein L24|nr:50S ribosomal protein L24 [Mycoplasmataceae bacterium]